MLRLPTTISLTLIALFTWSLTFSPLSQAFTMSNAFYIIILGNLNSIAGQPSNGSVKLTFTSGELGAGLFTGTNYTICAGFYGGVSCTKSTVVSGLFTFTVTPTDLDFGTVDPTSPVTRTNILNVLSTASGYSVTGSENHSLQTASGSATIPDTTCDNGLCTLNIASSWTSNLTYGFGYRCDNVAQTDCISFPSNYYQPFANAQLSEQPQIIMHNTSGSLSEKQSQVTYKVNVSGSQLPGVYTNTITYIASPNF